VNPAGGGPIEGVRQLTAVNQRYGHHVELLTLDAPGSPWLRDFPIPVHAKGPGFTGYGWSRPYLQWLEENAKDYDVVVVNGVWGFNALAVWLALRRQNIPYIVFTHGMLDPWFKYRYPLKHLKKWLYWPWGLYPVLRDAAGVFFTCDRERVLARESFWLYDCHEVVVRYGTAGIPDADHDYREEFLSRHPTLRQGRNILFFGRVHPKKGPDLLIRALGHLQRAGHWQKDAMRLVMAGPADSAYAQKLKDIAREEGVEELLYWTGLIVGTEKWGAFQSAEAFILPSHQENFGIAVAEALSARVPVLISHSVNISPEIAADGAGFVDDDTVDGTYRLLKKWMFLPPAERQAMAVQARRTFLQRYTAEVGAKDMLRGIYLALAARKRSAAAVA
jgi:glycosyltransferase involved in cell wall biosynthesis